MLKFEFIIFTIRISEFKIYKFCQAQEDGGVTVVSTAVSDREGVGVGAEGDGRSLRVFTPYRYHPPSTHMGIYFVGVQTL